MNWKELNKKAVILFASGKVKRDFISKNFGDCFVVGDEDKYYNVRIVTENGFNKVFCDCKNVSLCPESICSHKLSVLLFSQREVFL